MFLSSITKCHIASAGVALTSFIGAGGCSVWFVNNYQKLLPIWDLLDKCCLYLSQPISKSCASALKNYNITSINELCNLLKGQEYPLQASGLIVGIIGVVCVVVGCKVLCHLAPSVYHACTQRKYTVIRDEMK